MSKSVTIRAIATASGFSRSTVSAALLDRPDLSKETKAHIQKVAAKLGYRRNAALSQTMGELGRKQAKPKPEVLLWLHDHPDADGWANTPWLKRIYQGAQMQCKRQGYLLDTFKVSGMRKHHIETILRARGVRGIVISSPPTLDYLPRQKLDFLSVVQIQATHEQQHFDTVKPDFAYHMRVALDQARMAGYQRIGLCLLKHMDHNSEGLYRAVYLAHHAEHGTHKPIPPCLYAWNEATDTVTRWYHQFRPELILCADGAMQDYLLPAGLRVPEDLCLLHLNLAQDVPNWAGIDRRHDLLGSSVIDTLNQQIRSHAFGPPESPRATLIRGRFKRGKTFRPRRQ